MTDMEGLIIRILCIPAFIIGFMIGQRLWDEVHGSGGRRGE